MFYHSGIGLLSLDVSSSQEIPAEDEADENWQDRQTMKACFQQKRGSLVCEGFRDMC